jgi:hypothetical protein
LKVLRVKKLPPRAKKLLLQTTSIPRNGKTL